MNSKKIGKEHEKDMKWAMIFFWAYVVFVAITYLFILVLYFGSDESIYLRISIFYSLYEAFNWFILVCLVLSLFLPLRNLTKERQRSQAYLFAAGSLLLFLIYNTMYLIFILSPSRISEWIFGNYWIYFIYTLLLGSLMLSVFFAYNGAIRLAEGSKYERFYRDIKPKLPFRVPFERSLSRPIFFIIVFAIVGIILGSMSGIGIYRLYNVDLSSNDFDSTYYDYNAVYGEDTTLEISSESGTLSEGNSEEFNVDFHGSYVCNIQVILSWRDEADLIRYENTPDRFKLETIMSDETYGQMDQEQSGENEYGGEGVITIQYSAYEGYPYTADGLLIRITLEDAGNFQKRFGPGIIGRTDDQNDYDLQVALECIV
jgi:hypothetical protein